MNTYFGHLTSYTTSTWSQDNLMDPGWFVECYFRRTFSKNMYSNYIISILYVTIKGGSLCGKINVFRINVIRGGTFL